MKRKIFTAGAIALFFLCVPLFFLLTGFILPAQFSDTYYAELGAMYSRLKETAGKKIVVIGTSNIAFGVDSALIEEELSRCGTDYTVCNFGLYGAVGTKAMLDLALDEIGADDLVILSPELYPQSLSTYFSGQEMWRCVDGDISLLKGIKSENIESMIGCFPGYVQEKYSYFVSGKGAEPSGVYAKASFDEDCVMRAEGREYNVMKGLYDANNPIHLDASLFTSDFLEYVNDYSEAVSRKGATMYFSFAPMNRLGISDSSAESVEEFYDFLAEELRFEIISDPNDYIMDAEWFYDSNFHLNASGMTVRSVQLLEDIKNLLKISAPTEIPLPEKPEIPEDEISGEGNNDYADAFLYEIDEDGCYRITGMTEAGKKLKEVIVPYSVNGIRVSSFTAEVFSGNKNLVGVTLQENITSVPDRSFFGCTALEKLIIENEDPAKISVGYGLLEGAEGCKIYVPSSAYGKYAGNYFWSYYNDGRLKKYD